MFWVLLQSDILSYVESLDIEFWYNKSFKFFFHHLSCHNLIFLVLSQFMCLCFVTIWVFSQRAVNLKISWEEWDYCFHYSFLEVLDFVKYFWNVEISHLDPENISWFFCKCFLISHYILKLFPQTWHIQPNQLLFLQVH